MESINAWFFNWYQIKIVSVIGTVQSGKQRWPNFNYRFLFSGEEHISHSELVGSSRDLEGHEVRLAAVLGGDPQTPPQATAALTSGRTSGKNFSNFKHSILPQTKFKLLNQIILCRLEDH